MSKAILGQDEQWIGSEIHRRPWGVATHSGKFLEILLSFPGDLPKAKGAVANGGITYTDMSCNTQLGPGASLLPGIDPKTYPYIHSLVYSFIHYITLRHITLHYMTLHCNVLHCITLH